jgi:prophage regulatory protein
MHSMPYNTERPKRLLKFWEVMARTGLGRTNAYKLMAQGEFPKPVRLSARGRAIAWPEEVIEEWIASRPAK